MMSAPIAIWTRPSILRRSTSRPTSAPAPASPPSQRMPAKTCRYCVRSRNHSLMSPDNGPMATATDYYGLLGVARNATEEQIRSAYRKLARQFHPDVNKDTGAPEKFKQITEA